MPAGGLRPHTLKHLELRLDSVFEPALLTPLTKLQHLHLQQKILLTPDASQAPFMQLAQMTQLTFLSLECAFDAAMPATSFAAITSSSLLHEFWFQATLNFRITPIKHRSLQQHVEICFPTRIAAARPAHTIFARSLRTTASMVAQPGQQ
jgi:hypothetical protein